MSWKFKNCGHQHLEEEDEEKWRKKSRKSAMAAIVFQNEAKNNLRQDILRLKMPWNLKALGTILRR